MPAILILQCDGCGTPGIPLRIDEFGVSGLILRTSPAFKERTQDKDKISWKIGPDGVMCQPCFEKIDTRLEREGQNIDGTRTT